MKYLPLFLLLFGCSDVVQSYNSEEYKEKCDQKCLAKYNTHIDWVGVISGKCYCK